MSKITRRETLARGGKVIAAAVVLPVIPTIALGASKDAALVRMDKEVFRLIDEIDGQIELPSAFIVPGGSGGSGALDLARSLVRTSERRVVALQDQRMAPKPEVLRYLNRLSDLLFMLARFEDKDLSFELSSAQE